jgi:hypothetical protein
MKTITVSFAYPTSPDAVAYGLANDGAWMFERDNGDGRPPMLDVISGTMSRADARRYAAQFTGNGYAYTTWSTFGPRERTQQATE